MWRFGLLTLLPFLVSGMEENVGETFIVGGSPATAKQFPWMCRITVNNQDYCGGSIISNNTILTAAHCSQNPVGMYKVHAGSLYTNQGNDENLQTKGVGLIIIHPEYDDNTLSSDLAVWTMNSPFDFNDFVSPVEYHGIESTYTGNATVSGWGTTKENGQSSQYLQYVEAPMVANGPCNDSYSSLGFGWEIDDTMCCNGEEGIDACQGDSGGPMVKNYPDESINTIQIGIVSWGYGCGRDGYPGVYTNVAKFQDFIDDCTNGIVPQCNNSTQFQCNNGNCINKSWECDYDDDCGDNSDEEGCDYSSCNSGQFTCESGQCIPGSWECDRIIDCIDYSDETNCGPCNNDQFTCDNGICIPDYWECDGYNDCGDNSDETAPACPNNNIHAFHSQFQKNNFQKNKYKGAKNRKYKTNKAFPKNLRYQKKFH